MQKKIDIELKIFLNKKNYDNHKISKELYEFSLNKLLNQNESI